MLDEIHLPLKDDAYEIHVDSIACYLASLHFKSSYLGSLWDLFPWLTLLEHGLSFFGPLDGPTHSQHALQRLLHGIAVGLPLLNRFQPMERSYHIIISVNNCPALDIFLETWVPSHSVLYIASEEGEFWLGHLPSHLQSSRVQTVRGQKVRSFVSYTAWLFV